MGILSGFTAGEELTVTLTLQTRKTGPDAIPFKWDQQHAVFLSDHKWVALNGKQAKQVKEKALLKWAQAD